MYKNIISRIIFLSSALCLLLASCTKAGSGDKVTLEFAIWGDMSLFANFQKSVKHFNKTEPDIEIKVTQTPNIMAYTSKMLARQASGDMPDMFFLEVMHIDKFIKRGLVADLSELSKDDDSFNEKDFFPQILDRFRWQGALYGLPRDVAPFACVYYNKKLFDKAGVSYPDDNWDLDDFVSVTKNLTVIDDNGVIQQYGFVTWMWNNFLHAYGGRYFDDDLDPTRCLLDREEVFKGMQLMHDLIHVHKTTVPPTSSDVSMQDRFMTGQVGMYLSGVWESHSFRNIKDFDWDIAMFPKSPDGYRGFPTGGSGYAVSETCKNKQAAWKFLKSLTDDWNQQYNARTGGAQPSVIKIAEGEYWAKDLKRKPMNKGMLNEAVKYIIFNPRIEEFQEIQSKIINPGMELILRDEADIQTKLAEMTREVNRALKER